MAKARAIAKRKKSVQNIRKITRTMQLIATARFQAAFNRATATKPYTENITRLVEQLSSGQEIEHPLLRVNTESKRLAVLVLTSNRGLCGGYNSALLRKASHFMAEQEAAGKAIDLRVVGKKGIAAFNFHGRPMTWKETGFEDRPSFADVEAIASGLMDSYERRELDAAHVVYMKFMSAGLQHPEVMPLLPIARPAPVKSAAGTKVIETPVQYEFTPAAPQLLAELLPEMVRVRLFQAFTDAAVSEHTARMVAMKAATDAAGDMIRSLGQQFNRARQSQITLELLDIVGGAEALA